MTIAHPENLKRGDWITVVGIKPPPGWIDSCDFQQPSFNGRPGKVIHVELPWLVVEYLSGRRNVLDFREVVLQRVSEKFVSSVAGGSIRHLRKSKPKPQPQEPADPRTCQRCGGSVVQLLVIGQGWQTVCRECGAKS